MRREGLRRHGPVLVALGVGFAAGFLARTALAVDDRVSFAIVGVVGALAAAVATDLAAGGIRSAATRGVGILTGRLPGHRRLPARYLSQTRVLPHVAGGEFARERWVDLADLDTRGYFYGVAQSPTYVPLYGNGLVDIPEIEITLRDAEPVGDELRAMIDAESERLAADSREHGRPFADGPLVRVLAWTPPVDDRGPLAIAAEVVGHRRYAATSSLLRADLRGALRQRYGVDVRRLDNAIVCGCLGVEVAVVTADGQLVLARRGDVGSDYRGQTVVSIGEALHPELDAGERPGTVDPFSGVTRGALEELGIEVDGRSTRFLALGLETTRMDPDLLGYIRVEQTAEDVRAAHLAARARDRWETRNLTFQPFTPESVAALLTGSSGGTLTPATPMNLVFALSDAFGERAVARAMAG